MGKNIEMVMENRLCPGCQNDQFRDHKFSLLQCKSCGLVVNSEIWAEKFTMRMDEEWFESEHALVQSCWEKMFEAWNNRRTYMRLNRYIDKDSRKILEVGVGSGSLLKFLQSHGFEVVGCDLSKSICTDVQNTYDIEMHNMALNSLPYSHHFDCVIMNHVLEHVNDPIQFLTSAGERMKSGGILHVSVPNIQSWESRLPGWNAYEAYHLTYFSKKTLLDILKKCGFRVIAAETYESFSGWFLAVLRTLLKTRAWSSATRIAQKNQRKRNVLEHGYRTLMVAAGALLYPLRMIQAKLNCGDELIVIAENK